MKKILGFDLGTTSIGWAYVHEAQNDEETSKIIRTGVRVVPLSSDEQNEFESGKDVSTNVARRMYRGMRRNTDRYQLRRDQLIRIFREIGFIDDHTIFAEDGKDSTHETYFLRSKAVREKIRKDELVRVLLMINKKRGYKSNRKGQEDEDGTLIDGMALARKLRDEGMTPGQYLATLDEHKLQVGIDFYKSDLVAEFDRIWNIQSEFYPDILTAEHKKELEEKNRNDTARYLEKRMGIQRADPKGSRMEKRMMNYQWRAQAAVREITLPELAYVLTELNNEINQSSGYLNAISDRSKELAFNGMTVGEYLYHQLWQNPHQSLRNQVFYRQDYIDEFNAIWEEQSKHYPELTERLKKKVGEETIFYQRRLRSQKGLVSICELERREVEIHSNGKTSKKWVGPRVAPKSSPLFQVFKIWQVINHLRVTKKSAPGVVHDLTLETKIELFEELDFVDRMTENQFLRWLFGGNKDENPDDWRVNFPALEGNRTRHSFHTVYVKMMMLEGNDKVTVGRLTKNDLRVFFEDHGIDARILDFDPSLEGQALIEQPFYKLWHLLYSYEADQSKTGNQSLIRALMNQFGFSEEQARIVAGTTFEQDYGNLSVRAMRKILPHLQDGLAYDKAAAMAGYNHSGSVTADENLKRELAERLDLLKKNSLRNPVVEKILNQMINVTNAILDDPELGRPDEIRIELARELRQTQEQRRETTSAIARATRDYEKMRERIKEDFGLPYVSRNDLIKYRLYKELEPLGYRTPYSDTYIEPHELFSNKFDVEHIIPRSRLFDDSFANKTLELRSVNIEKGNMTAYDYCEKKGWLDGLRTRTQKLLDAPNGINFTKARRLMMKAEDIPDDFLNRDLGNTAYIARKAREILLDITRRVTVTSGKITARLREDWGLIDVLKELNWPKYKAAGMTYYEENRHKQQLRRIEDWTKRNDHRHHAMDAITVAFTKPGIIQYLNNLNAESRKGFIEHNLEKKHLYINEKGRKLFKKPFPGIRQAAKEHLEATLISFKAKNKVTTLNTNTYKIKGGVARQETHTPRGQLHKETVYGRSKVYVTKMERVGGRFDRDMISTVANQAYREALMKRLEEFDDNPRKAFTGQNSLKKNPILLPNGQEEVPERVKTVWLEDQYTIRKDVNPDNFKNQGHINKVVDVGVRRKLQERVELFDGDFKEAFSNLDENPIWLNKDAGIPIKRVTMTGVSNAIPVHFKRDHFGKKILDERGEPVPADYVSTGNNHHVAIYRDENGDLKEEVVSFFEAVVRRNTGLPIIERDHPMGWEFLFTMKQNEMFVFPDESSGFDPAEIDLKDPVNRAVISPHLFRVQKFATRDYWFRHHLETLIENKKELSDILYYRINTPKNLTGIIKLRLNHLGEVVQVGEY